MSPAHLFRSLLLNCLIAQIVPAMVWAAFEAPRPYPVSFALCNLSSFPDFELFTEPQDRTWRLQIGAARLYSLPEVQPITCSGEGLILHGRLQVSGYNLAAGPYRETSVTFGYERLWFSTLAIGLETSILQVAIANYGSAHTLQFNARIQWNIQPSLSIACRGINLSDARIGSGHYPLPQHLALGGKWTITSHLQIFSEVERLDDYPVTPRIGAVFAPLETVAILAGFQSDPEIISLGISALIGSIRSVAAWQYHPDLGLSQCYGLAITF